MPKFLSGLRWIFHSREKENRDRRKKTAKTQRTLRRIYFKGFLGKAPHTVPYPRESQ
jgi:hypothetical protein